MTDEISDQAQPPRRRKRISFTRAVIGVCILLPLLLLWTSFMRGQLQSFRVISRSMEPALKIDDCVIMSRVSDDEILRGRIITFDNPMQHGETLTKRVIADGGDRVTLKSGRVYINSVAEPTSHEPVEHVPDKKWELAEDEVFVMGDNRNDSFDSIDFGPLKRAKIGGVLKYRYWPAGRIGRLE
ncbi:MAG: signal peptidase I [Candidatus Sumerlaeaceae bacterium]|nr:signal peptidase I [Candidatus Sumerlaeaceae bacterium]